MESLIHEFLKHLEERKYSTNSIHSHRLDLLKFAEWLAGLDPIPKIMKINASHLESYREYLLVSLKPRTVARHLSSLKLFFNYFETQNLVKQNPLGLITFPEIDYEPPPMLSPDDVTALLEAPDSAHFLGLRDRTILELLYSSGLKVMELTRLNVDDVFLDLAFVKIRGKRERMVPLTSTAIRLLRQYLEPSRPQRLLNSEDPCLFSNKNGVRITRIGIWFMIKRHAKSAGIKSDINGRILRHSFAMHLIQNGMDLDGIKALFGYVVLEATQQYAHVSLPDFDEAYHQYHPRAKMTKDSEHC